MRPPAQVEPTRYEELAEGGTIAASQPSQVNRGFDNVGGRGMLSIIEGRNPDDAPLLQAFGRESSNLSDPDRKLIFLASPTQLLIVETAAGREWTTPLTEPHAQSLSRSRVFRLFVAGCSTLIGRDSRR